MMFDFYMATLDDWLLGVSVEEGIDEDMGDVRLLRIGIGLFIFSIVLPS